MIVALQIKTASSGSGPAGSPQSGPPQKQFRRQLLTRIGKKKAPSLFDGGKQASGTRYHTRGEEDAEKRRTAASAGVKESATRRGKKPVANKGEERRKNWRVETLLFLDAGAC